MTTDQKYGDLLGIVRGALIDLEEGADDSAIRKLAIGLAAHDVMNAEDYRQALIAMEEK